MCKQRCAEDERARIVICRMKTVNENEKRVEIRFVCLCAKKHKACCKKYMACIFRLNKSLNDNDLQKSFQKA